MKKFIYSIAALAMTIFAGSCQHDAMEPTAGGDATVTFAVRTPGASATKAISDGMKVDEVWYAVYKGETGHVNSFVGGQSPLIFDKVTMSGRYATVSFDLIQDQDYVVVFWAQVSGAGHYNLGDLRQISLADAYAAATAANDETRDAFYAVYKFSTPVKDVQRVELYRPFAQLNLATTVESLSPQGYKIDPQKSCVKVTGLSTVFNVLNGDEQVEDAGEPLDAVYTFETAAIPSETVDPQTVTVNEKVYEKLNVKGTDYVYIGMNYLFAPVAGTNVTVEYDIYTDKGGEHPVNNTIDNVTVKKNFRTNIIGNLLTSKTDFEIVVIEGFVDSETGASNDDIIVDYWDGTAEAVLPDPVTGNYVISTAEQLAWLSAEAAKQPYDFTNVFSYKTIEITNDIDLNGKEFTPINMQVREDASVKIVGNGHTISNFKVSGTEKVGLFSHLTGTVSDLHVSEVETVGTSYVGALAGYVSGLVEGCSADNVEVVLYSEANSSGKYEDGDKGGALVGYFYNTDSSAGMRNCSATNSTVTGCRQLGALVGYAYAGNVFEGNTAENVVITLDRLTYGASYAKAQTAGLMNGNLPEVVAGAVNVKIVENVSEGLVMENGEYYVQNAAGLAYFSGKKATDGTVINLATDINFLNADFEAIAADYGKSLTFNGNGHTISNINILTCAHNTVRSAGLFFCYTGGTLRINDLKVDNAHLEGADYAGVILGYTQGDALLKNIEVMNSSVSCAKKAGGLVGFVEASTTSFLAENCHVINTGVVATEKQAGTIIGYNAKPATLRSCTVDELTTATSPLYCDGGIRSTDPAQAELIIE